MAAYLDHTTAAAIVATIPSPLLGAYASASSADQDVALGQASSDVDNAIVWQGRLFDPAQANAFPRVAYESPGRVQPAYLTPPLFVQPGFGDLVWDWDADNSVAVVPADVLAAVVHQANAILLGDREQRLAEQHDGVSDTGVGSLRESYRDRPQNKGLDTGLCRRAYQLVRKYQAVAGRIL